MNQDVLNYEVNFLTAEKMGRGKIIQVIEAEFDFVRILHKNYINTLAKIIYMQLLM